ncbi:trypsin-like peptidase domain-containing protein [Pseudochryseolinea flava]|uniref:Serine protease n=1 Tax=Pseudochryseolinea flava TaxID=2059302 RepID=A0A364Y5I1_9BACT|nr:trypsin-like peptidase domain-containing protein [Pseudochryseolinea flava]RAW02213.1 hypothetical protein DQQ10_06635 [Pseudochryseolinea flava]
MYVTNTIAFILLMLPTIGFAQTNDWVKRSKETWPPIAMINEVWFRNGERYVHPSFDYVATGFLIDTGSDTVAATVKHALWVAKTKSMRTVSVPDLARWIMHPKGNLKDSVVIDKLINADTTEILSGPQSTITQRDWLVFTTKYRSTNIQPLKARYTAVKRGERIYFTGCPYSSSTCTTQEATVLYTEGDRIIFTAPENLNVGGYSGSPLIDQSGFLIGILGGSSFDKRNGQAALYGISTRYLSDVLSKKSQLNVPLIPIESVIQPMIHTQGINASIRKLDAMLSDSISYFTYTFSMENISNIGDELAKTGKIKSAIKFYALNRKHFVTPYTYLKLAQAHALQGDKKKSRSVYKEILEKWPDNKEAREALEKLK